MRKNYSMLAGLTLLFSALSIDTQAQLMGVYTINSASPTGGTNFANFTDFATAYNTQGLGAPVTVNVVAASGPYVEQVNFIQTSGTSSANRVTINGNGNLITFASTSSSAPYTIRLEGADNITINDLQVEGTGTYAYPLLLWNGANNNIFSSCSFSVPLTSNSTLNMPVVVSGSGTSYSSMSNSGNNNLWQGCTTSGGYYGMSFYGSSSAPYNYGNRVIDCDILDWYSRGISHYYYQVNYVLKDNFISRPNRTNSTTAYGIYSYYNEGTLIEGNRIQGCFDAMTTSSSTFYGIYMYWNTNPSPKGNPNIVRNNIIADINNNGGTYGMAVMYIDGYVYHNTISLDNTTATGGVAYGLYTYSNPGKEIDFVNNIVSITKGGSSTKYGMYYAITGNITADYNDYYVNATNGSVGYYNGAMATLASFQAATGQDMNSVNIDPQFTNIATNNYMPTNAVINDMGTPRNLITDIDYAIRNQTTPDIGALEFLTPACAGTPATNTVLAPTYSVCPGEDVYMILANLNPASGFTYQWQSSNISNVGPFTQVSGATSPWYTAPSVTNTTWYSVVMTCTNPGGGATTPVAQVMVSGPTVGSVPYYEGFEGIGMNNRLPNCSWSASGMGSSNLTYTSSMSNNRLPRTGNNFASFSNSSTGPSYFYTHPIQMNTNITYSAALHFATEYFGYSNWTSLSIEVGPNQNPTGMVTVASISPAISGPYKLLDGTFSVPTSGLYYVAIKAVAASGNALYLSIDDISITIPCEPGSPNSPTVSMSVSNQTICAGDQINLTAVGADTYSWNNGASGSSISDAPSATMNYIVYGTNTVTGCTATVSQMVNVNPSPTVIAIANPPVVCAGSPAILTALGAVSYGWSNSQMGQNITVNPTSATNYTVIGTGNNGCTGNFVVQVGVVPLPTISVISSNPVEACKDDQVTFTAAGASTYLWSNNISAGVYQGSPINITVATSAVFTVTGTGANGCTGTAVLSQNVSDCTGIDAVTVSAFRAYPNPGSGLFTLEFGNSTERNITVSDLTGRVVSTLNTSEIANTIDLSTLSNGVYFATIRTSGQVSVIKLIKE